MSSNQWVSKIVPENNSNFLALSKIYEDLKFKIKKSAGQDILKRNHLQLLDIKIGERNIVLELLCQAGMKSEKAILVDSEKSNPLVKKNYSGLVEICLKKISHALLAKNLFFLYEIKDSQQKAISTKEGFLVYPLIKVSIVLM